MGSDVSKEESRRRESDNPYSRRQATVNQRQGAFQQDPRPSAPAPPGTRPYRESDNPYSRTQAADYQMERARQPYPPPSAPSAPSAGYSRPGAERVAAATPRSASENQRSMSEQVLPNVYPNLSQTEPANEKLASGPSNYPTVNSEVQPNVRPLMGKVSPTVNVIKSPPNFEDKLASGPSNYPTFKTNPFFNDARGASSMQLPGQYRACEEVARNPSQVYYNQGRNEGNANHRASHMDKCSTSALKSVADDFVMVNQYGYKDTLRKILCSSRVHKPDESCCAACGERFGLEVYQCAGGHSVCDRCRAGGRRCACGEHAGAMRNWALEAILLQERVNCPNTGDGCSLRPRRAELPEHLRECIYRDMDCPLAAVFGCCSWRGKRGVQMVRHFDERHSVHRQAHVNQEALLRRLDRDDRIVHFVLLEAYTFLVHIKISESSQTLHMAVQIIGTKNGARKWCYAVNFYSRAEPRRKLEYSDVCTHDGEDIADVFAESRCLVLSLPYVRGYMNYDEVTYKFFIMKTGEEGEVRPQRQPFRTNRGRGRRGMSR